MGKFGIMNTTLRAQTKAKNVLCIAALVEQGSLFNSLWKPIFPDAVSVEVANSVSLLLLQDISVMLESLC